jgi:hypothetical protein
MRVRVFLGIVFALLVMPAVASAKGPDAATIDGKGLAAPISVKSEEGSSIGRLADDVGFFPATFAQTPDPMLAAPPTTDLGPKLTLRWRVPSDRPTVDTIRQDLYPYAGGGPLTFTEPGQRFFGTELSRGGWFRASSSLLATLTRLGVPDRATLEAAAAPPVPPAVTVPVTASTSHHRSPWPAVAVIGAAVLGVGLATTWTVTARRRTRVAPA